MFSILSKHDCVTNEKCPRCLTIFQHFLEVGEGLLACLKCGCVFVSKAVREEYTPEKIVEFMKSQAKAKKVQDDISTEALRAGCGFGAKNKAGLVAHERHCQKCDTLKLQGAPPII